MFARAAFGGVEDLLYVRPRALRVVSSYVSMTPPRTAPPTMRSVAAAMTGMNG